MAKGTITVNEVLCKGCGLCIHACPKEAIALAPNRLNAKGYHPLELTNAELCTGCGLCAVACPDAVISVYRYVKETVHA